jgi:hypothetical protein
VDVDAGTLAQVAGQRPSSGESFEAPPVPAATHRVAVPADVGVAYVARSTLCSSVDPTTDDLSTTDSGARFDVEEMLLVRPVAAVLGQGEEVDVVVDQDRDVEDLSDVATDVEPVPTRHDRPADDPAGQKVDRGRQAESDADEPAGPWLGVGHQLLDRLGDVVEDDGRTIGQSELLDVVGDDPSTEVGDDDAGALLADVHGADEACEVIEAEDLGRPSS